MDTAITIILPLDHNLKKTALLLEKVYDLMSYTKVEVLLLNQVLSPQQKKELENIISYFQHQNTFILTLSHSFSMGYCWNICLAYATNPAVWFANNSISSINREKLTQVIPLLYEKNYPCLNIYYEQKNQYFEEWIKQISKNQLPPDIGFIWNISFLKENNLFFNPFLNQHISLELILRQHNKLKIRKINPFFVLFQNPSLTLEPNTVTEFIFCLLKHPKVTLKQKQSLFDMFLIQQKNNQTVQSEIPPADKKYQQGSQCYRKGNMGQALELLNEALAIDEHHYDAISLKIWVLEKLHRFVEAAELSHQLKGIQKQRDFQMRPKGTDVIVYKKSYPPLSQSEINLSLIIPIVGCAKDLLSRCLGSIAQQVNSAHTEIIIIDNTCIDDTKTYIQELCDINFFNLTIIENPYNRGFGSSINQGIKQANGLFCGILHNDVILKTPIIDILVALLEENPTYSIAGISRPDHPYTPSFPLTIDNFGKNKLMDVDYIESSCMVFRKNIPIRFNEDYHLAWFEDMDFCHQARQHNLRVGIAPQLKHFHTKGSSSLCMGADFLSPFYWKNMHIFHKNWHTPFNIRSIQALNNPLKQLVALGRVINIFYPQEDTKQFYNTTLTSKIKELIISSSHSPEALSSLAVLFITMDNDEMLNKLDPHINQTKLEPEIFYLLANYYYKKNIYSRSITHLEAIEQEKCPIRANLLALQLSIKGIGYPFTKEQLESYLKRYPANPLVLQIASNYYTLEGDLEQTEYYRNLAKLLDPHFDLIKDL